MAGSCVRACLRCFSELLASARVVLKVSLRYGWYEEGRVTLPVCQRVSRCLRVRVRVCVCLHMSLQVSPACRRVLNFEGTQTFSQTTKKSSSAINLHFLTVPSTLRTAAGIGRGGRRRGGEGDWWREEKKKITGLSLGDYLQRPRSLYLSNLDEMACRGNCFCPADLLLLYYLPLPCSLTIKKMIFHKDKHPGGWDIWFFSRNLIHD